MSTTDEVDAATKAVAEKLALPHTLEADMGGDFVLQIDLGTRGGPDHPGDRAMIAPDEPDATWWFDVEGGRESIDSGLAIDTDPAVVAAWIREQAAKHASPAWLQALRELGGASSPAGAMGRASTSTNLEAHQALQRMVDESRNRYTNEAEF